MSRLLFHFNQKGNTMRINLYGHHFEITEGIQQQVNTKLTRLAHRYPNLMSMTAIVGNQRNKHTVELNTSYRGVKLSANASEKNLFLALAKTCKKLEASLAHRKGQLKARLHDKHALNEFMFEHRDEQTYPV